MMLCLVRLRLRLPCTSRAVIPMSRCHCAQWIICLQPYTKIYEKELPQQRKTQKVYQGSQTSRHSSQDGYSQQKRWWPRSYNLVQPNSSWEWDPLLRCKLQCHNTQQLISSYIFANHSKVQHFMIGRCCLTIWKFVIWGARKMKSILLVWGLELMVFCIGF